MSRLPELNEDFRDVLRCLIEANAEVIVVGAHALAVHGVVRATGDLDLLIRPTLANAQRVLTALRAFGAPVDAHGLTVGDLASPGTVYQMGLPPRRIDVINHVSGLSFDEVSHGAIGVRAADMDLVVMGRDELLRNKRAAARDKDLIDVRRLEALPDPRRRP